MKIAVVGRGHVGGTLGRRLADAGHEVVWGVRDPAGDGEATPDAAAAGADVVLLAVPASAAADLAGSLDLAGRLVLDCTNPVTRTASGLGLEGDRSAAERVQAAAPGAAVFKTFNTTGWENMADPVLEGRRAMMPFCGDDDGRRATVRGLVEDVGFEPFDAGGLGSARFLEGLAVLWIGAAMRGEAGRGFAFGLLRR